MTDNTAKQPSDTVQTNVFTQFPPIIPMVILGTALIAAAQFGSTERLAAAFAWLIFVAVLLTDGQAAFINLSNRTVAGNTSTKTE